MLAGSGQGVSAVERLALSILLEPRRTFDATYAMRALARHGIGDGTAREVTELAVTAAKCPAYRMVGQRLILLDARWAERTLERALIARVQRLTVRRLPPARPRASAAKAGSRARPAPADEPKPRCRTNGTGARKARSSVASPGTTPPEPKSPALPAPGAAGALQVVTVAPERSSISRLFSEAGELPEVSLALRAHALSTAQKFHELIGLGTLVGVDSHTYQVETVRRVLRVLRGRALLADEVGLGKTIEALMILREYQLRGMARRVLVLAPAALVRHWVGELSDKGGLQVRSTHDRSLRTMGERFWSDDGVVVASLALARGAQHAEAVRKQAWDLVIVDEAHHVKNRRTASYALVDALRSRFLLLVTATPIETDLDELYNLVTLVRPGQFATPAAFRKQYVDTSDPTSPKNRERLRSLLAEVMVRNTRARCGLKLPPRFVTTVVVEPNEPERAMYQGVLELVRRHGDQATTRMAVATLLLEAGSSPKALEHTLERVAQNARYPETLREHASKLCEWTAQIQRPSKDNTVLEIVRSVPDQTLVFTRYRRAAEHIAAHLSAQGFEVGLFHGGLGAEEKEHALARFRAGSRCLVATDVGGEGQNLQFCHLLINYDLPWNPMQIEQRIGRLHRMGQTEPVRVFNLCAKNTAEERLLDVLDRRLSLFELVVGEMDMVLGNLADERDLEQRILGLYATSGTEDELDRGFDTIAEELSRARTRYERTRAFDEALFGADYEA